eukprot:12400592-Karenia_brevis.AAC.1
MVDQEQCPGPQVWGLPQMNRPWVIPRGHDTQWGTYKAVNTGPQGHKLQWFKGIMYCIHCGAWTAQGGRPK